MKNLIRSQKELKNPKEIVNDYDYSDYTIICNEPHYCTCERLFGTKKCIRK